VRSLRDAEYCIRPLEQLGYEYRGEARVPGRAFFRKGDPRTHHLHVTEIGSEFWERQLLLGIVRQFSDQKTSQSG